MAAEPEEADAEVIDMTTRRPPAPGAEDTPAGPGTAIEHVAEVVDDADVEITEDQPRPVDTPDVAADTGGWLERHRAQHADAAPIIPTYLRHRGEFSDTTRFVAEHLAHIAAFHATRSPLYLLRLAARGPRGMGRGLAWWARWVVDAEGHAAEVRAAAAGDNGQWLSLSKEHTKRIKPRAIASAVVGVPLAAALVWAVVALPVWAVVPGLVGVLALFGLAGRRPDRPILSRYVAAAQLQRPLESAELIEALNAIGVKGSVEFVNDIHADGPGWAAEADLPRGTTAAQVLDKREDLAGAMRRPVSTVWPSTDPAAHPSRLNLWVAKRDPAKEPRRIWPLMQRGQADVFAPLPLGWDPRGNLVEITLMYSNLLVGGIPGSGKTSAALAVALGVALDPTAELWVYELKGSGDLGSVQPVCHRYVSGDDDEDVEATVKGLRSANAEQKRRKKFVQGLPVREVPDGRRVTRELADRYPDENLGPVVVIIDEAQELFGHEEYGAEAEGLCKRLIKKARAYGIVLVLLTQDPDAKSLPPTVSRNAGTRLCLAVMDWRANNNVLGTGAYARGLRATDISAGEVGTGILVKQRDNWTVRCAFIKQPEAEEVGRRALALRTAAGTLTGEAAGQEVAHSDACTIVDHLRAVWPDGEDAMHSVRLVAALAAYRPDDYGPWTGQDETNQAKTLAAALRPYGVPTGQVQRRGDGGNRKGVRFADLPAEVGDDAEG